MSKMSTAVFTDADIKKMVVKDEKGYTFTVPAATKTAAFKAATDLDSLLIDVKPIAINLWKMYKKVVKDDALIGALTFYNAFDQTIPLKHGAVGSPERKAKDAHPVLNRLIYLTMTVGRTAAGDKPKPRDPKTVKAENKAKAKVFGEFAKKYKLTAPAVKVLVLTILGFKAKDGKATSKGKKYMEAAGLSMTE